MNSSPPPLLQGQLPRWLMFREEQRGQLPPEWSHMEFHALDSELLPDPVGSLSRRLLEEVGQLGSLTGVLHGILPPICFNPEICALSWQVLPIIVFFSCAMSVLYYVGLMQWVIMKVSSQGPGPGPHSPRMPCFPKPKLSPDPLL